MIYKGQKGNGGFVEGEAVVVKDSICWWGGVDIHTGRISESWLESKGTVIAGKILLVPSTKGSGGNWSMLVKSVKLGKNPKGIIMQKGDPLVVGAAFTIGIPYIFGFNEDIFETVKSGDHIVVDGDKGQFIIESR